MKTILRTLPLLLLSATLSAVEAPKLEQLLQEYHHARADVIAKLTLSYAAQVDTLAQQYRQAHDQDHTQSCAALIARLKAADELKPYTALPSHKGSADPVATLEADYLHAREDNFRLVDAFYISNAQKLQAELLRENNTAGARTVTDFIEKVRSSPPASAGASTRHRG